MAPRDYIQARKQQRLIEQKQQYVATIDDRPYYPFLTVDPTSEDSVRQVTAKVLLSLGMDDIMNTSNNANINGEPSYQKLIVTPVTGGNTNSLFRVSGLQNLWPNKEKTNHRHQIVISQQPTIVPSPDTVLMRVFGAAGIIDRDVETATYAALARQQIIAAPYYGRFGNGRLEGWLSDMKCLDDRDLAVPDVSHAIATRMAEFHTRFQVPHDLLEYHNPAKPALWNQIGDWVYTAMKAVREKTFVNQDDLARLQTKFGLSIDKLPLELKWLQEDIVPGDALVSFCHNDVLASNIMVSNGISSNDDNKDDSSNGDSLQLQLIDFEYGGINFSAFDIANHFNEFAGGTIDGVPNYDWFPSDEAQRSFIRSYLQQTQSQTEGGNTIRPTETVGEEQELQAFHEQVKAFILVNHLFWGLWGVNQAATEGCQDFDYLLYGSLRIQQYYKCKDNLAQE